MFFGIIFLRFGFSSSGFELVVSHILATKAFSSAGEASL